MYLILDTQLLVQPLIVIRNICLVPYCKCSTIRAFVSITDCVRFHSVKHWITPFTGAYCSKKKIINIPLFGYFVVFSFQIYALFSLFSHFSHLFEYQKLPNYSFVHYAILGMYEMYAEQSDPGVFVSEIMKNS